MLKWSSLLVVVVAFAACSPASLDPRQRAGRAMTDAQRYAEAGAADKAAAEYDLAARLSTSLAPQAYYEKGRVLLDDGQPTAAVTAFTQAIELRPKYAQAYWYRGMAYHRLGMEKHTQVDQAYAQQLDPDVGNTP